MFYLIDNSQAESAITKHLKHREKVLDIKNYIKDGFVKVCDVEDVGYGREWKYKNINRDLMFSSHNSWVYFIVENNTIVKCGETSVPLGIEGGRRQRWSDEDQPKKGTKCRFGRLRSSDSTDQFIRHELRANIRKGSTVSLWAIKCEIQTITETINGIKCSVNTTIHHHMEQLYLEYFINETGFLPDLNKGLM